MRKNEVQFIPLGIAMLIVLLMISIPALNNIETGLGFGKDTHLVIETSEPQHLKSFLERRIYDGEESLVKKIDLETYSLKVSGISSNDEMLSYITQLRVATHVGQSHFSARLYGIFGSNTKYANILSFISLQMMLFIVVLSVYFTIRFGILGLLHALKIEIYLMGTLFITQLIGVPFTKTLWVSFLLSYYLMSLRSHSQLYALNNNNELNRLMKYEFSDSLILLVISSLLIFHPVFSIQMIPAGLFLGVLGIILILQFIATRFYLFSKLSLFWDGVFPDFKQSDFGFEKLNIKPLKMVHYVLVALFMFNLIIGVSNLNSFKLSIDFQVDNVLVVPISGSSKYLDVQALLSKSGVINLQNNYLVSEPVRKEFLEDKPIISTWIYFHDSISMVSLHNTSTLIYEDLGIDSITYTTMQGDFPFDHFSFYIVVFLVAVLAAASYFIITRSKISLAVVGVNLLSSLILWVLYRLWQIPLTSELVLSLVLMPIWSYVAISSGFTKEALRKNKVFQRQFYDFVGLSGFTFLLITIPILIILPDALSIELLVMFLCMIVALVLSISILYILFVFLVRRYKHDSRILR